MKINYHKRFVKQFEKIPHETALKLIELEDVFKTNPFDSSLKTKPLQGKLRGFFSFRATRDYRVIFRFVADKEVDFLVTKHRRDIYR